MPNTAEPPGDVHNFDPIATFPAMASYAGPQARLVSLTARYVRTDGKLDLGAEYGPSVRVELVTRATAEDVATQGKLPPGSGFKEGDDITTTVSVITPRMIGSRSSTGESHTWRHLGMARKPEALSNPKFSVADAPTCLLDGLWKTAIARGAPADVVAIIQYDADGYRFEANGRDFKMAFSNDCQPR